MRSWGVQKFLNPVSHADDGWFKFSIRKKSPRRNAGITAIFGYDTKFIISDCSNKVVLDFDPYFEDPIYDNDSPESVARKKQQYLSEMKNRLDKVDMLAKGVVDFQSKLQEAYKELETELDRL